MRNRYQPCLPDPCTQLRTDQALAAQIASLQGQLSATNQLIATQTALTITQLQATPIAAFAATLPVLVAPGVVKTFVRTTGPLAVPAAPALDYRAYVSFQTLDGAYWLLAREFDVDSRIFGAKWDFNTDDWRALQMCADYIGTRGVVTDRVGVVYVGGYSLISQTLVIRYGLVGIRGDGQRVSMIRANSDIGDIVLVSSSTPTTTQVGGFCLLNITIRQYFANTTGGAALHIRRGVNVNVRGVFLYNHFGGLLVEGGAIQHYTDFDIRSGVLWAGGVAGTYMVRTIPGDPTPITGWNGGIIPNEIYFSNFSFDGDFTPLAPTQIGNVERGIDYRSGDGVWMVNGHCFGTFGADCWIEPYTASTQCDHLACTQVWFDSNSLAGTVITGSVTNPSTTAFGDFQFTGCKWLGNLNNGYNFSVQTGCNVQVVSLTGCHLDKAGLSNIALRGLGTNFTITGGDITMAGQQGVATDRYGILIADAPTDITISGVTFGGAIQGASAVQAAGIAITGGAPDFITIGPCTYRGGIWSIRDFTTTKHKVYSDPTENELFWQGIVQSSNVLQIQPAGSYFILDATSNDVNDMICRWNRRRVTLQTASSVIFRNNAGVMQTKTGSDTTIASGKTITFAYNGTLWQEV